MQSKQLSKAEIRAVLLVFFVFLLTTHLTDEGKADEKLNNGTQFHDACTKKNKIILLETKSKRCKWNNLNFRQGKMLCSICVFVFEFLLAMTRKTKKLINSPHFDHISLQMDAQFDGYFVSNFDYCVYYPF